MTGVYGGHTTVAPIDAAQVLRVGMALYTAPPEPPADVARDAERWQMLPAFLAEFQVPYLRLVDKIDAAIEREILGGEWHDRPNPNRTPMPPAAAEQPETATHETPADMNGW